MISQALIRSVSAALYERSLKKIPDDTRDALGRALADEGDPAGRRTLATMLESAAAAAAGDELVCTDVGIPVYSVKIGTLVRFEGALRQAIVDGFADLVQNIRPPILQMVTHPLTHERGYAGKDMPVVTYDVIDGADYLEMVCSPKAMGSGRWEELKTFVFPTREAIEDYVLEVVMRAGSQPCPPIVVGVGIGGSFDYAARLAKQQVLRPVGTINPDPDLAAMEDRLLAAINGLGYGPMGTGGDCSAIAVHVDYAASHGFMPVAVALNCWINRRMGARISNDGHVEWFE